MNENGEPHVTYRGRKRSLDVKSGGFTFEYNITSEGLTPGEKSADTGFDLRDVGPFRERLARRAARDWLLEAWIRNPNI